ncbi:GC-rich sequence DNA-binding factor 2 GC-rich sequence DNA-binding factor Transcription factor 9 [Channa argus]|uniref:GC-rich sequence DNA-binding factor 2 GC-rich sequence DNA-binding factor Transcription factor 9 n=1 Tax=Channa argus TaxID=215402 RepID=A0A6G1P8B9_CHAAH|nr:GC-rich sequence DNA-binding factor 2 GC-rich sequence DNA-binding factor Transcription factor 9 [Channa argus]
MFTKKPRRNFRQRKASSSDEENQQKNSGDGEGHEKTAAVVNKASKLAQGRGISCSSKREATPPKPDNSDEEDGETLDVTGKREEKKKDKDEGNKNANTILSFSDDKEAEEPTFKLRKSSDKAVLFQARKKEASAAKKTLSAASGDVPHSGTSSQDYGNQALPHAPPHDNSDGDDDDDVSSNNDDDSDGSSVRSFSASSASDSSRSAAKPVIIPNSEAIKAARRQRRATRTQKEFIPLGKGGLSPSGSSPDHYSRSNEDDRLDDNDDDDELDDHERVIEFAPRLKSIRERIADKLGGSDGSLSWTDGEEQELWEETQIEKGVKRRPGGQSPSGSECSSYSISSSSSRRDRQRPKKKSAGVRIPKTLPHVSVSVVKKRIMGKLDSLKEVHRARQAELRRMEGDVESAKTSVETLEETSSERQLKFYRAMTLYVHNLVECLQEKVVEINSLELELHTLLSDHMEALEVQRRHKIKEQADYLQQLSYGSDERSECLGNGNENQGEADVATEAEEDSQDIPEDTQLSAEEEEQVQKKMADILSRSQAVFSDVQHDFCDVKKILSRFEEWRASYSDSYHSAYISLCLPKLLNPIIRHQLLAWNPLKDASGDFENLPWFTALETFCHGHGHEELDHTDRQTLSNVIEKTVLSKITTYVELLWDPISRCQSVCLSNVCHRLNEDYSIFKGEQSKQVKALIDAVLRRLRSCVDEDVFIPLYPKKYLEDRSSPQSRFRDQQFWMAIKLLGNMGKWDLLLPESGLKELMLDKLLNRYLMITLYSQTQSSDTVRACNKIADSLPPSWFNEIQFYVLHKLHNCRNTDVEKAVDDLVPAAINCQNQAIKILAC